MKEEVVIENGCFNFGSGGGEQIGTQLGNKRPRQDEPEDNMEGHGRHAALNTALDKRFSDFDERITREVGKLREDVGGINSKIDSIITAVQGLKEGGGGGGDEKWQK